MNIKKPATLLAALATCGFSGAALAGTATGSLPVSAIVLESCTVVATPLIFAGTANIGSTDVDSTATITLSCTPNADFYVSLDQGTNAVSGARNMKIGSGTEMLPYEIYQDASRTQIWGNSAGVNTKQGTAPLGVATMTAYGRIPSTAAAASAGAYSDTVTVTVVF